MQDRLEKLIKVVYREWKAAYSKKQHLHPDEESIVCFLENRLSVAQDEHIRTHIINCDSCAEIIALQLKLRPIENTQVPPELIYRLRDLVTTQDKTSVLEIILRLKEKTLEILNTTGDVLVGQEFIPAPILRSRQIQNFKDQVKILKDFEDIRVEANIENQLGQAFSLSILIKEKKTLRIMKDLRVTLIKDDLELESYLTDSGKVTFENVLLGKYRVEISTIENKLASILLDIKT